MSFAKLKQNRKKQIQSLAQKAAEATSGTNKYQDDRFWSATVDKSGNGYAVIRFLPAPEGNDIPWVQYWSHGFQGPTGRWYIEKSLTSIGQSDPVSDANSKLWATGTKKNQELVRKRKRKLNYVANILVVKDSANPENNGKNFLYRFGKKIFDKIHAAMEPQFEDEEPLNPFDFWEGANFKLKIRKVDGQRNYDHSVFDSPSALFDGDEKELEALYEKTYDLNDFIDPKNYKSYEELEKQFNRVLGEETVENTEPVEEYKEPEETTAEDTETEDTSEEIPEDTSDSEEDSSESYFQSLANKNVD